ncbi:hypothetical protein LT493_44280 [Streptomyces tricolor]|nr:hypothetical protein [Streptomyces tricolor]
MVNSAGNIYRYTNNDASPWVQIPGALTDIEAPPPTAPSGASTPPATSTATPATRTPATGSRSAVRWSRTPRGPGPTMCGINSAGNIYRHTNNDLPAPGYGSPAPSPTSARRRRLVWGVNSAGNIYRYTGDQDTGHWKQIGGGSRRSRRGRGPACGGSTRVGNIYRFTQQRRQSVCYPGGSSDIGAGRGRQFFKVPNSAGNIYRYTGDLPGRPASAAAEAAADRLARSAAHPAFAGGAAAAEEGSGRGGLRYGRRRERPGVKPTSRTGDVRGEVGVDGGVHSRVAERAADPVLVRLGAASARGGSRARRGARSRRCRWWRGSPVAFTSRAGRPADRRRRSRRRSQQGLMSFVTGANRRPLVPPTVAPVGLRVAGAGHVPGARMTLQALPQADQVAGQQEPQGRRRRTGTG